MESVRKKKYSIVDFLKLVKLLRASNSFRWDKSPKHANIRSNLIEEAYEVLEAIDLEDREMLEEELGDILFQIALHCDIEEEDHNFSFDDVVDKICKKIISKNPHLFSEEFNKLRNKDSKCQIYNMHERDKRYRPTIKKNRNIPENSAQEIENVSRVLPALMRTSKVQQRAARSGYGLFSVEDAINETFERLHYLETLILDGRQDYYEKEIGELLFSVTQISRLVGIDAEGSLYDACERFKNEFLYKISLENRGKV